MCGIAGFVGAGGEADLRRMTDALVHRGPDAGGRFHDAEHGLWLGHRRLAVVDLESGDQPMATAEGDCVVVFNGEIYNAAELRKELEARGRAFRSHHSDTEVLLHGYREWGDDFVTRLDGMWAFALFDRRRRRLLLSRDRFGEKPLYWARRPGLLAFASELEALARHPGVGRSVCPRALRKYLAHGYVPAPGALYREVWKLPAGTSLAVDLPANEARPSRYWRLRLEPAPPGERPEAELAEALREKLERAVARRLVADVPLGVFLSGGVDSSAVALLAARRLAPGELRTFSVGFEEPSFDESRWAALVAERAGSRHRVERLSVERVREVLPEVAARLDEPLGDASLLPTYLLCGAARREVTVALGGDGGDELFAGYAPFRALGAAALHARLVPRPVHRALCLLAARLPTSHAYLSWDFALKRTLRGLSHPARLWAPVWMGPLDPRELGECLAEPVQAEEVYSEAIECWDAGAGLGPVERTQLFFAELYLQNGVLAKVDRASMMHALEVRSPFLDLELVDFARRLPTRAKLRGGETKVLLRRALAPLLPREILRRPKRGFAPPVGRWLADGAPPFDALPDPGRGPLGAFLARRLAEHRAGRADHRLDLFAGWLLAHRLARDAAQAPS